MLYECDNTNCNAGAATCQNRAFARLQDRIKAGGKYRVGVEVVKTEDRGFGIRANRCFEPGQIIMEYTGEIITEEECEHRMEEKYKDNEVRKSGKTSTLPLIIILTALSATISCLSIRT